MCVNARVCARARRKWIWRQSQIRPRPCIAVAAAATCAASGILPIDCGNLAVPKRLLRGVVVVSVPVVNVQRLPQPRGQPGHPRDYILRRLERDAATDLQRGPAATTSSVPMLGLLSSRKNELAWAQQRGVHTRTRASRGGVRTTSVFSASSGSHDAAYAFARRFRMAGKDLTDVSFMDPSPAPTRLSRTAV